MSISEFVGKDTTFSIIDKGDEDKSDILGSHHLPSKGFPPYSVGVIGLKKGKIVAQVSERKAPKFGIERRQSLRKKGAKVMDDAGLFLLRQKWGKEGKKYHTFPRT